MNVLYYNQGGAGAGMMGAASLDPALRVGLGRQPGIDIQFLGAPASSLPEKVMARPWWPLSDVDADFHTVRWQYVESMKAKREITSAVRRGGLPDRLMVNSHAVSYSLGDLMSQVPTFLHVDVLTRPWNDMEIWRRTRRHSTLFLRRSISEERRTLERAAVVLAWTRWAADQVAAAAPQARVAVWHPGIDTERYRPVERLDRPRPSVLFVGGRFEQKGGPELLEALGPFLGRELDLHVVTPAAVPAQAGLFVHRLGLGDPQLLNLFQQADLLCLPTKGDTNPWVLLEAMACGTPVVATTIGAIPELLDHGTAGALIHGHDVGALRESILGLLADSGRRTALGAAGRATVCDRYDAVVNGRRLAELFADPTGAT